jgi:hypothetical protein
MHLHTVLCRCVCKAVSQSSARSSHAPTAAATLFCVFAASCMRRCPLLLALCDPTQCCNCCWWGCCISTLGVLAVDGPVTICAGDSQSKLESKWLVSACDPTGAGVTAGWGATTIRAAWPSQNSLSAAATAGAACDGGASSWQKGSSS